MPEAHVLGQAREHAALRTAGGRPGASWIGSQRSLRGVGSHTCDNVGSQVWPQWFDSVHTRLGSLVASLRPWLCSFLTSDRLPCGHRGKGGEKSKGHKSTGSSSSAISGTSTTPFSRSASATSQGKGRRACVADWHSLLTTVKRRTLWMPPRRQRRRRRSADFGDKVEDDANSAALAELAEVLNLTAQKLSGIAPGRKFTYVIPRRPTRDVKGQRVVQLAGGGPECSKNFA